jgi:hypothetical protein
MNKGGGWMTEAKWYAKPVYALFALALVLSLGIVAVPTAGTVDADGPVLSEDFEATWVSDSDGDLAPQNWDVNITSTELQPSFPSCQPPVNFETYWSQYDRECGYPWAHSGDYCAALWWSFHDQDEWLISPELDFTCATEITLFFWSAYVLPSVVSDCVHNYIKVSTDSGATWTTVADLCQDSEFELGGSTPDHFQFNWYEVPITIDLSAYSGESSVRLAWQYLQLCEEGADYGSWMVDDVEVTVFCGIVGGEAYPVNRLTIVAPWVASCAVIAVGASIAMRRRRAQS